MGTRQYLTYRDCTKLNWRHLNLLLYDVLHTNHISRAFFDFHSIDKLQGQKEAICVTNDLFLCGVSTGNTLTGCSTL